MEGHVRFLAILNIVFGSIGLLVGTGVFLLLGGIGAVVGTAGDADTFSAFPILGAIGGLVFMILFIFSAPQIIGGIGLLKGQPWARILMIALSAINLISVPIGTLTGAYGLWVLLNEETTRMFASAPASAAH